MKIQNQNEKTVKIIFRGGYEEKGYKFLLDKMAPPVRYLSGELCYLVKQDVLPLLNKAKILYEIVDNQKDIQLGCSRIPARKAEYTLKIK